MFFLFDCYFEGDVILSLKSAVVNVVLILTLGTYFAFFCKLLRLLLLAIISSPSPMILGSPDIREYNSIVFNFFNYFCN